MPPTSPYVIVDKPGLDVLEPAFPQQKKVQSGHNHHQIAEQGIPPGSPLKSSTSPLRPPLTPPRRSRSHASSVQFVKHTRNGVIVGSRTSANDSGSFLIPPVPPMSPFQIKLNTTGSRPNFYLGETAVSDKGKGPGRALPYLPLSDDEVEPVYRASKRNMRNSPLSSTMMSDDDHVSVLTESLQSDGPTENSVDATSSGIVSSSLLRSENFPLISAIPAPLSSVEKYFSMLDPALPTVTSAQSVSQTRLLPHAAGVPPPALQTYTESMVRSVSDAGAYSTDHDYPQADACEKGFGLDFPSKVPTLVDPNQNELENHHKCITGPPGVCTMTVPRSQGNQPTIANPSIPKRRSSAPSLHTLTNIAATPRHADTLELHASRVIPGTASVTAVTVADSNLDHSLPTISAAVSPSQTEQQLIEIVTNLSKVNVELLRMNAQLQNERLTRDDYEALTTPSRQEIRSQPESISIGCQTTSLTETTPRTSLPSVDDIRENSHVAHLLSTQHPPRIIVSNRVNISENAPELHRCGHNQPFSSRSGSDTRLILDPSEDDEWEDEHDVEPASGGLNAFLTQLKDRARQQSARRHNTLLAISALEKERREKSMKSKITPMRDELSRRSQQALKETGARLF